MGLLNFTQAQLDSIITAINNRAKKTEAVLLTSVGAASGVAGLGTDGKVPAAQLPAVVAGLSDAGHSFTGNGYLKLSNGMILQWMTWTDTGAWTSRSYPIAFPNACLSASFTPQHPSGDAVASGIPTLSGGSPALGSSSFRLGLSGGSGWNIKAFFIGY